jgi:DNA-binding response OmpR family regulator
MNNGEIKLVAAPASAPARNHAQPPSRILLVDDETQARELIADVLVQSGYNVDTAEDGAEAWKALNNATYDLMITDNRMPRVTGLELIKKLRSDDMTLPVILASGTVPTEELERYPWLRLDAVLPKPFTIAELLETVIKVLRATESARVPVAELTPNSFQRRPRISFTRENGFRHE